MSNDQMNSETLSLNEMLQIRRDKLKKLQEAGKNPFKIEKYIKTHHSKQVKDNFEKLEGSEVSLAGRIMSMRGHGKASFIDIQDEQGRIQVYVRQDAIGDDSYTDFVTYDIGDIIGVEGTVFMTNKGEQSVKASKIALLTKSLQILPEKYHGLKDPDLRYRQRYVDLIVNPDVKEAFLIRSKAIKALKEYLDERDFLEVDTPILSTIAGGATARPFITHHNTLDIDMYMRIANELYLKRLIVGGFERVYELGKMFRNEGMSIKHNPEYTAIEVYQAYADYEDIMKLTEEAVACMAQKSLGTTEINYQGTEIDLTPPWRRLSMIDAIKEFKGIDFNEIQTDEEAIKVAKENHIEITPVMNRGFVIAAMFEEFCEEHLIQPTFITHHPVEVSPLSKRNPDDPRLTNRFEAFVNTWEIANAFSELNDPIDQRERFMDQLKQRELGDDEAYMLDEDFLNAIEVGLPPTGGLGIGIDRVIMLLTNSSSIRDVILFPTMKPIKEEKNDTKE
ncbi:lysine--tRNA ligase [Acetoanaerobium noterae]|uniref:lysine--tRNA ligase n=1 Tax=Acetoanaerobium noterae TaxID=745369 RepID=UPI0028A7DB55|nr:lysine--tRNA ligase [Acetoanaerobium noterae]